MKKPLFLVKWFNYEYWPVWAMYWPMALYFAWKSLQIRVFFWNTLVNPGLDEYGGFFGESKSDIYEDIPKEYLPKQYIYDKNSEEFSRWLREVRFPLIVKPDVGERGNGVCKYETPEALQRFLSDSSGTHIVQEYVDYPMELGIFVVRMPWENFATVTSITTKKFLVMTGDGKTSLGEWIESNPRAAFQKARLYPRFQSEWNRVLPAGETLLLEGIGNHCLGTEFCNGNAHISPAISKVFSDIILKMPGYYYGRFELRAQSFELLEQGKEFRILEFNGISAEPTHIYDKKYNWFFALRDVKRHWDMMFRIAVYNKKQGVPYQGFSKTLKKIREHFS